MTPPGWLTRARCLNELISFTDFAVKHMGVCKLRVELKVRTEPERPLCCVVGDKKKLGNIIPRIPPCITTVFGQIGFQCLMEVLQCHMVSRMVWDTFCTPDWHTQSLVSRKAPPWQDWDRDLGKSPDLVYQTADKHKNYDSALTYLTYVLNKKTVMDSLIHLTDHG